MPDKPISIKLDMADLQEGIFLTTGISYKLEFIDIRGILAGYLCDQDLAETLPDYAHEIYDGGKKLFEGKTDENGFFQYPDVAIGIYTCKANGEEHLIIPIDEDEEPVYIAVMNEKGETD